jgi:hypothetical protein
MLLGIFIYASGCFLRVNLYISETTKEKLQTAILIRCWRRHTDPQLFYPYTSKRLPKLSIVSLTP